MITNEMILNTWEHLVHIFLGPCWLAKCYELCVAYLNFAWIDLDLD